MADRIVSYITLDQFQDLYLSQNRLCIFSPIFTDDWRSRHEWVMNGKPNLEYLSEQFGNCTIQAADCSKKQFNSHEKVEMTFKEFLQYWKAFPDENQRLLYLKDWHFQREFPGYRAYEVPEYFQSDWLNEWYDQNEECIDDYRFVYMGPKGTWTAFHADVLSCWYHQVHNLEDTISINHNWTNAYGINFVLRHLEEELKLVEKEIAEFRDNDGWLQQCQVIQRIAVIEKLNM